MVEKRCVYAISRCSIGMKRLETLEPVRPAKLNQKWNLKIRNYKILTFGGAQKQLVRLQNVIPYSPSPMTFELIGKKYMGTILRRKIHVKLEKNEFFIIFKCKSFFSILNSKITWLQLMNFLGKH